jgi:hypothetical protein
VMLNAVEPEWAARFEPRSDGFRPGRGCLSPDREPAVRPDHGGHAARRGHHAPNAMGNFCFEVTLDYRRLERPRRVTGGQ